MKYKIKPCIHNTTRKRGYKIVENNRREHPYSPDGKSFTVYYNYQDAEDDCNHLNGDSKVFGMITKSNWDMLRDMVGGWKV